MNRKILFIFLCTFINFSFLFAQKEIDHVVQHSLKIYDSVPEEHKSKKKILPMALPVTDPAIGYGLIGGLVYFFPKDQKTNKSDIAGIAGGITSNGTWFGGAGYAGYWKQDRLRYTGFIGYGEINLDYYGFGGEPIEFSQQAFVFLQQLMFRISDSDYFIGGNLRFSKIQIPIEIEDIVDDELDIWNNGFTIISEYDNLNNSFSPTAGKKLHLSYNQNLEILGSQSNWGRLFFYSHFYFPVNEKWVPALRIESNLATGKPPFYAYPYVKLRGIPALRYQAEFTILAETQQLYNIRPRWGVVGFAGIGAAISSVDETITNQFVWNVGGGARYLLLKDLGIKAGMDIARGPEDWAFYISLGSAW